MSGLDERFARLCESLLDDRRIATIGADRPQAGGGSWASVLILLSTGPQLDITFTERSHSLRNHPGQIAFPGGRREEGDDGPAGTALREAHEEIGLDPSWVKVLGLLPATALPVSRFDVRPVMGVWSGEYPVRAVNPSEVASVHRWPIADLVDPANRYTFRHPMGHVGPAWQFGEYFLWGFTAYLADHVLRLGGWEQPWDHQRMVDVPKRFRSDRPQLAI